MAGGEPYAMSYRDAADQVVTAVTGITAGVLDTEHVHGLFTQDRRIGSADYVGGNRDFNLVGFGGYADPRRNARVRDDVDLLVDYLAGPGHDAYDVDVVIRTDYAQLVKTLQAPANWGSAICMIYPAGDTLFPYSIEDVEDENGRTARRLIVSFSVEHEALS